MTTDTQLKIALSKMLPEKLAFDESFSTQDCEPRLRWLYDSLVHQNRWDLGVLDTELLHICWLIEEKVQHLGFYNDTLARVMETSYHSISTIHATWQQRATALAKVKGVEV